MIQKTICFEGIIYETQNFIHKNALVVDDDAVPVTVGFDWEKNHPIGKATNLVRNEETGELMMDIEFDNPEDEPSDDYEATIYANKIKGSTIDGILNIHYGVIRAVVFIPVEHLPKRI